MYLLLGEAGLLEKLQGRLDILLAVHVHLGIHNARGCSRTVRVRYTHQVGGLGSRT